MRPNLRVHVEKVTVFHMRFMCSPKIEHELDAYDTHECFYCWKTLIRRSYGVKYREVWTTLDSWTFCKGDVAIFYILVFVDLLPLQFFILPREDWKLTKIIQFILGLESLLCEPSFQTYAVRGVCDSLKTFSSNKKKAETFAKERRKTTSNLIHFT